MPEHLQAFVSVILCLQQYPVLTSPQIFKMQRKISFTSHLYWEGYKIPRLSILIGCFSIPITFSLVMSCFHLIYCTSTSPPKPRVCILTGRTANLYSQFDGEEHSPSCNGAKQLSTKHQFFSPALTQIYRKVPTVRSATELRLPIAKEVHLYSELLLLVKGPVGWSYQEC